MEAITPKIQSVEVTEKYGRFVIEPLERGFGTTIGNALRRVLLSSIPGAAITTVKIEGVQHEFSTLPGVVEDVTDIILNLKNLAIKVYWDGQEEGEGSSQRLTLRLDREGAGEVTAADIEAPPEVEIINRGAHIATLDQDGRLHMEMIVERGKGYLPADRRPGARDVIGEIAVSAIFTPVPKVNYIVEPTRVGHKTDLDRLTLEIWTNGTIHPTEALSQAARILQDHLRLFFEMGEEAEGAGTVGTGGARPKRTRALSTRIEDLDFSVRTSNCLRNQGIETLGDLLQKSEAELLATRHFGKKSLSEVKEKLAQYGLSLAEGKEGAARAAKSESPKEGEAPEAGDETKVASEEQEEKKA